MANAFNKEFLRSISHSAGRFVAIAVISALGVGFFAGLLMTAPDMKLAGDIYYDGTNMTDLRVVSTLGFDDEQIEAMSQVEGVKEVVGEREADVLATIRGTQYVVRIHGLDVDQAKASDTSDGVNAVSADETYINRPILLEGEWPDEPGECVLARGAVLEDVPQIGDTVTVIDGTTDVDDTLTRRDFVVTGFVQTGYYVCTSNFGLTSLGTGTVDDYMYIMNEDFNPDMPYTGAFVTVEGARELNSTSEEYDGLVGKVRTRLEDMSGDLGDMRLAAVKRDAQDELDESRADYESEKADAESELADAKSELDDAKGELDETKGELADAESELANAQSELADAQSELGAARRQLDDASAELSDARSEIASGQAELDDAAAQIADGEAELADAQAQYDAGVAELASQRADAEAQLSAAQAQLDEQRAQVDAAAAQLDALYAAVEQADQGLAQLQGGIDGLNAQIAELQAQIVGDEEHAESDAALQAQIEVLQAQVAALQQQQAEVQGQRDQAASAIQQIESGQAAVEDAQAELDSQRAAAEERFAAAQAQLDDAKAQLDDGYAQLDTARSAYNAGAAELADGRAAYASGLKEYQDGEAAYADGLAEYNNGVAQYQDGKAEYEEGLSQYQDGLSEYQDGLAEYEDARAEADEQFADAEAELADAQAEIDDIEAPDVYVLDRTKIVGVESFNSDAERIGQIASVFPLIFFLVAALVSLTTMTRMVDEERVLIGTYKALGYSSRRITSKYLLYALLACLVGGIVGIVALSQFLPKFIMQAYSIVYEPPVRPSPIMPGIAAMAMGLGLLITLGATAAAAASTLRETPALLMLPRTPKAGKRILLERIKPVWKRMSFLWKVTARNIFRFKQRFFMAVIGIAGCTALLLTGLGLHDSINDIIDKQYGELTHTDMTVRLYDDATDQDIAQAESLMGDPAYVTEFAAFDTSNRHAVANGEDVRFSLVVPQDMDTFADYYTLRERKGHEPLTLDDDSIILSEKLATSLNVKAGDVIELYEEDDIGNIVGNPVEIEVGGVCESYVANAAYLSPVAYSKAYGSEPEFLTWFAKAATDDSEERSAMGSELLSIPGVSTVSYSEEVIEFYRKSLSSVNAVVVVLVIAAAVLAFVVLYNLTNINITERVREIATLKVLGFTPREVSVYIFRETMLLSVIGALVGLVLGIWMANFVIVTAEVDQVMFCREIHVLSFVLAFLLTMVFSTIVSLVMKKKLDRISMVESLKSIE
ncbi:chromosome segregation protein [Slackia heliotrinireducens]|uniref:Predicted permease n=1 Tax=Slackia heliotrinireducens (strain ATCC 29202 / DSM 20476 / NCTC 11029 / RHS 1) TaxID=471855 RepID=C7N1H1_SLAHD|nr:FtsX-like permease family protein [Slackia heliotrinireducens]ACV21263.1 Predicted permease [Slackia heliotrinireducens DSM 20476]VEG98698.1 chromosome segregation protein [Slackia heliotrinireducens]